MLLLNTAMPETLATITALIVNARSASVVSPASSISHPLPIWRSGSNAPAVFLTSGAKRPLPGVRHYDGRRIGRPSVVAVQGTSTSMSAVPGVGTGFAFGALQAASTPALNGVGPFAWPAGAQTPVPLPRRTPSVVHEPAKGERVPEALHLDDEVADASPRQHPGLEGREVRRLGRGLELAEAQRGVEQ
jgi:hypothetical protein